MRRDWRKPEPRPFTGVVYRDRSRMMRVFAPVTERHHTVLVLASGPSGAGPWPTHPGVPVIAVNGAIDTLPWDPDYWITLDPSLVNQARFQNRRPGTKYFVAVDMDVGPDAANVNMRADFSGCQLLLRQHGRGASDNPLVIHVGNSGRAALQLALHMGASRIGVLGIDGTDEPYWHDPGGGSMNLNGLPGLVQEIERPDVEFVFGDTGSSRITSHPRAAPAAVLQWLRLNSHPVV